MSPDEPDGPDDGPDDEGPDDGPEGTEAGAPEAGGPPGEPGRRKRRRRRRRRHGDRGDAPAQAGGAQDASGAARDAGQREDRPSEGGQRDGGERDGGPRDGGQRNGGERDGGSRNVRQYEARFESGSGAQRTDGTESQRDESLDRVGGDSRDQRADQARDQRSNDSRNQPRDQRGGNQPRGDQRGGNQSRDQRGGNQPRSDQRGGNQPRDQRGSNQPRDQRGGNQPRDQRQGRGGDPHDRERRDRDRQRGGRDRQPRESVGPAYDDDIFATTENAVADDVPFAKRDRDEPAAPTTPSSPDIERHDDEAPVEKAEPWGSDDDAPAPPITLTSGFPADAPDDDPDPVTYPLLEHATAQLGDDVATIVGVRFVPAGRISWFDAGDGDYAPGDRVMVDADRGARLAWIATAPTRKATRDRGLRRVIRRANEQDLKGEQTGDDDRATALRAAKDVAAALRLQIKVFRVELHGPLRGGKLNVYYTAEDERARHDFRDFVRDLAQQTGARLEMRQLGVRDEAKVVGGIGSCGLTLCCTTWLPDFVPVSIKMAKDQGLVLSPTKVSGQCGRLKCCLVYEQAGYAELRKGLPKLGKRVISQRGEGRVVEVDVLRQRIRVSYGPGDTEVLPATEVKPMFPSGNQPRQHEPHEPDGDDDHDDSDEVPSA